MHWEASTGGGAAPRRGPRAGAIAPRRVAQAGAMALVVVLAVASGAFAASGGVGSGGEGDAERCLSRQFGDRALERGDCGPDVETLNWILASRDYGVPLERRFGDRTHDSVRHFQRRKGLSADGVVGSATRDRLVAGMNRRVASWYGPGFFGNRTACGQVLRRDTRGVAHRTLPCGTRLVVAYRGRFVRTRVIDRGPFIKRRYERDVDLTQRIARQLRFEGVDRVRTAVVR